tara:strand:- start:30 stop:542 length:513 start_codon:yes stop_codon:yes gene_type:complete
MPTLTFGFDGEEIDISNKSSKEVLDIVKKEYSDKQTKTVMEYCYDCNYPVKISKEEWDKNEGDYGWFAYCSKCEYKKKTLKEEKKQIDILKSQSVWKIYFGAVLQDIREPNWREEEEEEDRPTWEDLVGYSTGIYNSYKEMIYAEYGEHSEQALDLEKSFREAVEKMNED